MWSFQHFFLTFKANAAKTAQKKTKNVVYNCVRIQFGIHPRIQVHQTSKSFHPSTYLPTYLGRYRYLCTTFKTFLPNYLFPTVLMQPNNPRIPNYLILFRMCSLNLFFRNLPCHRYFFIICKFSFIAEYRQVPRYLPPRKW